MWAEILEFPEWEVSTLGGVRRKADGRNKYAEIHKGYLRVDFYRHGRRHRRKVHRLVAEAFIPNPKGAPTVNHKNGIKLDNHVENLEWMTFKENTLHAHDTGLAVTGTVKCLKYAVQLSRPGTGQGVVLFGFEEIRAAGFSDQVISIHANKPGKLRLHKKHEVAILPLTSPVYWC